MFIFIRRIQVTERGDYEQMTPQVRHGFMIEAPTEVKGNVFIITKVNATTKLY